MNLRLFRLHSFKTKVTLFTLAIFVVGFWSLAFYASRMLREDMQRLLGEQQFSTVSILADEVNQELDYRLRSLEQAADSVASAALDDAAMQTVLEQRPVLQGLFNGGTFSTRLDGTVVASAPASAGPLGINYMDRDYIAAALKEGKTTIGKPTPGQAPGAPVVAMAAPIHDRLGRVIGALAGVIELGKPNFLDKITSGHYGKSGVYLIAAPRHNLFVSASDKSRIMRALPAPGVNPMHDRYAKGYEGYGALVNYRGEEELTAAKGIPVAGWFLGIAIPATEALSPLHAMQRRMLSATLLLTLLAGGLIWWMLTRQLSPVITTARALAGLSKAKQHPQPLPVTRQDEIGELIGGFNHLLETLGQREALLRQILDASSVAIFLVDMAGRITQANQRMAEMFGWPLGAMEGQEYVALVHPAEREISRQKMLALLASELPSVDLDRLYWRADRSEFWGHLSGRRFFDANGVERGLIGVIADITQRKQAEVKLRENEHKLSEILENVDAHIYLKDRQGRYTFANRPVLDLFGLPLSEVVGQTDEKFFDARAFAQIQHNDRLILDQGQTLKTEETSRNLKDGRLSTYLSVKLPLRNEAGEIYALCGISTDISALKEHEQQLEHSAHFDSLTNLPNRVLLADRLHQAMAQALRRGQRLAVVYLDLDSFKAVNDRHGHGAGDALLIAMSDRMKLALREGDTLARIGGDEFVAVLLDLDDVAASEPMLRRLLAAAAQPVQVGDFLLQISTSLGVTFYPQAEEVDADQLLRQADQAMYQAKLAGKNRYHVFDAEQDRNVRGQHESVERIRGALRDGEFVLHYQPKVNMRSGALIGAEALIRWQHPVEGLLAPALFLPVIEDHPLAVDLGEWVIDRALTQLELWRAQGLDIPISVNIGARQLQQAGFAARLREILAAHPRVKPGDLELEVLETSALEDLSHVAQLIESCREIGVRFALDDFGTGYSSLTYLKRLQVFQLKIDRSFVRDMLDDPDDLAILEGVIGLATAFRRQVIAEGVETVAHGAMLLQLGCELAQGYGIARPMPAADLPGWSAGWRTDPSWADLAPVSRDDLPLLFASVEHRAWTRAVESHLLDRRDTPPALDHEQCHFGQWLQGPGLARHGAQAAFARVDTLHRQAHQLAAELCDLKARGRTPEALGRLAELLDLHDALLAQVNAMLRGKPA